MNAKRIGIVVGSLRKGSYSKAVARHIGSALAAGGLEVTTVEIGDLPLYNEDLETDSPPEAWTRFRAEMAATDAVLFVTPEYNRSIPAAIKNAIDVGSRPYGKNIWGDKPGAVASVTPGGTGAMGSNFALRQALIFVDVHLMSQPEAYVANIAGSVNEAGEVEDERTVKFLNGYAQAFAAWVNRF